MKEGPRKEEEEGVEVKVRQVAVMLVVVSFRWCNIFLLFPLSVCVHYIVFFLMFSLYTVMGSFLHGSGQPDTFNNCLILYSVIFTFSAFTYSITV